MMPSVAFTSMLLCMVAVSTVIAAAQTRDPRRSGFEDMSRESQAMQRDDTANPGMFAVLEGEELWREKVGSREMSCADCHQNAEVSMRGLAARYPSFDTARNVPVDLQGQINLCRETRQSAPPFPLEGPELLALSAYVGKQSRGMPIAPPDDARLEPFRRQGEALYSMRQGQLNFSCANCHDDHAGQRLAGSLIPQGHPTGYPLYRLEWQGIGSLQRRLRGCLIGVRAEPYAYGAQEYIALELFLMSRARGMAVEAPAIRP
jgi:sulfur-oxidizing protein SoxA